MAITASEIRTIANERTGRSEAQADIDKFIKSCMHDLSTRGIILEAEETVTLVDDTASYAESGFTNSFRRINSITIVNSSSEDGDPLIEIPWRRYKERVAQNKSKDEPHEYARFSDTIYLWPKPNATNYPSMKISGTIYHADSTTIQFPERFRELVSQYVIFKVFEKYGLASTKGAIHATLYTDEFNKMLGDQSKREKTTVLYNDV